MPTSTGLLPMFAAKGASGVSLAHWVEGYSKVFFQFGTITSANGTLKFQISLSREKPDFSAASTPTNHWVYASVIDMAPGTAIAGATGIVLSGTDATKCLELNVGTPCWISAELTWTAGAWTLNGYATPTPVTIS